MKLIIQIPCLNEEQTLPITLKDLPTEVAGFDVVEWLIIDDGSIDNTVSVAKQYGVHHVISHTSNQGLAKAFMTGIEACLKLGADVIVNTDADNQYNANDIPKLVEPILKKNADIVIGERPILQIEHFSFVKKILQKLGSYVVRAVSNTTIKDAPSGFRAYSRNAACNIMVYNNYTYTLETIIQAGQRNMTICSVPIRVNKDLRRSRLVKNIPTYIKRSIVTIVRIFVIYRPFKFFCYIGTFLLLIGVLIGLRYMYYYIINGGIGHIQSLLLSAILIIVGFQTLLIAFVADLIASNRKLLEDIRYNIRKNI